MAKSVVPILNEQEIAEQYPDIYNSLIPLLKMILTWIITVSRICLSILLSVFSDFRVLSHGYSNV
jgi:hypothetical protein